MDEEAQSLQQWELTSRLCRDLASAGIALKTRALNLAGADELTDSDYESGRVLALGIISACLDAVNSPFAPIFETLNLPSSLVSWLRTSRANGTLDVSALTHLRTRLTQTGALLDSPDVELLDRLTGVIDQQATALSRQVGWYAAAR